MPGLDRTGPSGQGPMTGRGRGVGFGRRIGLRLGRGLGFRRGLGIGRGAVSRGAAGRGAGGVDTCTCPKCGEKVSHPRGVPCTEMKCPKCGALMRGDYCLPENPQESPKENQSTRQS